MEEKDCLALDCETTGIDNPKVFLVCVYKPNFHKVFLWIDNTEGDEELLSLISQHRVIAHNIVFDYEALVLTLGKRKVDKVWNWDNVEDTLILAHAYNSCLPRDLTSLALLFLGVDISSHYEDLRKCTLEAIRYARSCGLKVEGNWLENLVLLVCLQENRVWWDVLIKYCLTDAIVAYHLFEYLSTKVTQWPLYRERVKLLPLVAKMHTRGLRVSPQLPSLLKKYQEDLKKLSTLMKQFAREYGYELDFNVGISNSLRKFVFECLCPGKKMSLSKDSVAELLSTLDKDSIAYQFLDVFSFYQRKCTALRYLKNYSKFVDDGVIRPRFNVAGTNSLRWSSARPNIQNVSKKEGLSLRSLFVPREGHVWIFVDAENIELRIPAYEAEERDMIDVFESNIFPHFGSYHSLIASLVYPQEFDIAVKKGKSFKEVFPDLYRKVKNGNFALLYGGSKDVVDKAYGVIGAYDKIFVRFSKLAKLMEYWTEFGNKYGYVETIVDKRYGMGYRLYLPTRKSHTKPFNYHVQGSAAYWLSCGLIELHELTKHRPYVHILAQIHDEVILEVPKHLVNEELLREVEKAITIGDNYLGVKIPVSIKVSETWK